SQRRGGLPAPGPDGEHLAPAPPRPRPAPGEPVDRAVGGWRGRAPPSDGTSRSEAGPIHSPRPVTGAGAMHRGSVAGGRPDRSGTALVGTVSYRPGCRGPLGRGMVTAEMGPPGGAETSPG